MQQIYRRKPMPQCDFNKVALAVFSCNYWNITGIDFKFVYLEYTETREV